VIKRGIKEGQRAIKNDKILHCLGW